MQPGGRVAASLAAIQDGLESRFFLGAFLAVDPFACPDPPGLPEVGVALVCFWSGHWSPLLFELLGSQTLLDVAELEEDLDDEAEVGLLTAAILLVPDADGVLLRLAE